MGQAYDAFVRDARALRDEMDQMAPEPRSRRVLRLLDPQVPRLTAVIAEHGNFDFNVNGDADEEDFARLRRALKPWTKFDEEEDEEFTLRVTDAAGLVAEMMRLAQPGAAARAGDAKRLRALARVPLAGAEWQFAEWHAAGSGETDALYKAFLAFVSVVLEESGREPMSEMVEQFFEKPHPVDVLGYLAWRDHCARDDSRAVTFEETGDSEDGHYAELSQGMSALWRSSQPAAS